VKTIQYVPQTIDNSSNSHLIFLQMQRKITKNKAKRSYDALPSRINSVDYRCPSINSSKRVQFSQMNHVL